MTARTRVVQNTLTKPGTSSPIAGRTVSIRLVPAGFVDGGSTEILATSYATTDATGLWATELRVNADIDPAGTYYTVREVTGVIWTVVVQAGTGPVWLRDCLTVDPQAGPVPVLAGPRFTVSDNGDGFLTIAAV